MTRLAVLLVLLSCPMTALSADNPLLGHWRACQSAEQYAEELEFRNDGKLLYTQTTYTKPDCAGPRGPTLSRSARYSFLREKEPNVVSFEYTTDHSKLEEEEEAWLSGYFTFLSNDTMSLQLTGLIVSRGGKLVHSSKDELYGQPGGHFVRAVAPSQNRRVLSALAAGNGLVLFFFASKLARFAWGLMAVGLLLALPCGALAAPDSERGVIEIRRDEGKIWEALNLADRSGARLQAAEIRLELGDNAGAEAGLKKLLEERPEDFELLLMAAKARRDRPDEALPYAQRAARAGAAGPQRGAAHLLDSDLRLDLGDAAGAEKSAERAAEEVPEDLDALHTLVRLKRARKPEASAYAERAERAAAAAPLWRRAAAERLAARVWLDLDEPSRAAGCLRRALELNPVDLDALGLAARIKTKLSADELAGFRRAAPAAPRPTSLSAEDAERALLRDPNDLEALRSLAALSLSRGRMPEAEAHAERFLRTVWKTPLWQQAEAYRTAAKLWIELGRKDRASQSLAKALALQQDALETQELGASVPRAAAEAPNVSPLISLYIFCRAAELRLALDDRSAAEALVKRALAVQPDHAWALRLRSDVLQLR